MTDYKNFCGVNAPISNMYESVKAKSKKMCYDYGERDDRYYKNPMICELLNDFRIFPENIKICNFPPFLGFKNICGRI